jgi:hypothetical protein
MREATVSAAHEFGRLVTDMRLIVIAILVFQGREKNKHILKQHSISVLNIWKKYPSRVG